MLQFRLWKSIQELSSDSKVDVMGDQNCQSNHLECHCKIQRES